MKYDFSFVSIRIKGYDIFYAEKRGSLLSEVPGFISFSAVHVLKFNAEKLAKHNKILTSVVPRSPPIARSLFSAPGKVDARMRGQGRGWRCQSVIAASALRTQLCPRNTQ